MTNDPSRHELPSERKTDQRDPVWPDIDPRVLRMGVSKIRDINMDWLKRFAQNDKIAVIQTSDEPLSVLVPYAMYQTMRPTLAALQSPAPPVSVNSPVCPTCKRTTTV